MIRFRHLDTKDHEEPGPWWYWDDLNAIGPIVVLCCPDGHIGHLCDKHRIQADGSIIPALICCGIPAQKKKCRFHGHVVLIDWV